MKVDVLSALTKRWPMMAMAMMLLIVMQTTIAPQTGRFRPMTLGRKVDPKIAANDDTHGDGADDAGMEQPPPQVEDERGRDKVRCGSADDVYGAKHEVGVPDEAA